MHGPNEPNNPLFNPRNRAGINFERNWDSLVKNPDGSVTIYLSPVAPADDGKRPNWLPTGDPAVDGPNFFLTIRLYGSSKQAQQGLYRPPDVLKA